MINYLHIKNFQSHEDSYLEFHPGVNVIVGSSDSGKSAIIRSLRLIKDNKPSGDSFRSHWGGDTEVIIDIGKKVSRIRNSKMNGYKIDDSEFNAIGTGVPEEIKSLLNFDELNLQSQLDSPFLITNTSGEVAQHFNKIAKLDKIDSSTKKLKSSIKEFNQIIKNKEEYIKEKEEELLPYGSLEEWEKELENIESLELQEKEVEKDIEKIQFYINSIEELEKDIEENKDILLLEKDAKDLLSLVEQEEELQKELKTIQKYIFDISAINKELEEIVFLLMLEEEVNLLLKIIDEEENIADDFRKIRSFKLNIRDINKEIKELSIKVKSLEDQFHKAMPDICPLCNTDLTKTK